MSRYRKRTVAGAVIELEFFNAPESRFPSIKPLREKIRTEAERREYNRRKSEKHFTRLVNANFDHTAYYVTLTYDNEHLPLTIEEAEKNLENYKRRLQRNNPYAKIIAVTGRGRRSGRLHHHLIVSGVSESDIIGKWTGGEIARAEHLREHNFYNGVDCGEDFTGLAEYLFAHTDETLKGRRWKQTKTIEQPKADKPKKVSRFYSEKKPPKAPEGYKLVDVKSSEYFGSGYICFKFVRIPTESLNYNRYFSRGKSRKTDTLNC